MLFDEDDVYEVLGLLLDEDEYRELGLLLEEVEYELLPNVELCVLPAFWPNDRSALAEVSQPNFFAIVYQ